MQIINSQYEVIRLDNEDKYGNTVIVKDIQTGHTVKKLRIINLQKHTQTFIEYMKQNFYVYKNLSHLNLAEFYFFNIISSIDTKPVSANKYYYTYEWVQGQNAFDFLSGQSIDTRLDIAIQLCSSVKYLHLKDFLLCNVNHDELLVTQRDEKSILKISSLPYVKGIEKCYVIDKDSTNFLAPELFECGKFTVLSDIYLIGVILFYLFTEYDETLGNFRDDLADFIPEEGSELYKIKKIVQKCTELDPIERYQSVEMIAQDINRFFDKNYTIIDKKYLQTLPKYNFKLIGREDVLKQVIDNISGYFYEKKPTKVSLIKGKRGTGKDIFLKVLSNRLWREGINSFNKPTNKNTGTDFYLIKAIVREVIKSVDKEVIDKFASDLSFILPELMSGGSREPKTMAHGDEKMRFKLRIGNFLMEASKKQRFVINISTFEWIDKGSLDIIDYIVSNRANDTIYVTAAFNEENTEENEHLRSIYGKWVALGVAHTAELTNFTIREAGEYIRFLLGTQDVSMDFVTKIYKITEGNPSYIYETVYLIFTKGSIYVGDDGKWVLDEVDFDKLNLSHNIDEFILNKINNIDPTQREILKVLSLFDMTVSIDILEEMLNVKGQDLYTHLGKLTAINILNRRIDDWGYSLNFSSGSLRKYIYDQIDPAERIKLHEQASYILERKFAREDRENKDELIYHMTQAGRKDEAIGQLIASAQKMLKVSMLNQSVQFLERTFSLFEREELNNRVINVCMSLGKLYGKLREYGKSLYYYTLIEKRLIEANYKEKTHLADIYIQKSALYYETDDVKNCLVYLGKAKRLIKSINYFEGLYALIVSLRPMMVNRRKYTTYEYIVETAVSLMDKNKYPYYYAALTASYGIMHYIKNKTVHDEALQILLQGAELLEDIGDDELLPAVYNCIAVIYADTDRNKAKEYHQKNFTISQRTNNWRYLEFGYNNLAYIYSLEDNYKETLAFYEKALDLTNAGSNKFIIPTLYINMASCYVEMDNFKKCEEYLQKAYALMKDMKDTGDTLEFYYTCKSIFHYKIGDYKAAAECAGKSAELCLNWGIDPNEDAALYSVLADIKQGLLSLKSDFEKIEAMCRKYFDEENDKIGRVACVRIAELMIEGDEREKAQRLYDMGMQYIYEIDTEVLSLEYGYIASLLKESSGERYKSLFALINQNEGGESGELNWKIYRALAKEAYQLGRWHEALKYYITAFYSLRRLVDCVPEAYQIQFLLSHGRNLVKFELAQTVEKITGRREDTEGFDSVDTDSLDAYFDDTEYKIVYRNENAKTEAADISNLNNFMFKVHELLGKFKEDSIKNLNYVIELCAETVLAKTAFVAIRDDDNNLKVLASYNRYSENTFYNYIIEQAQARRQSIIITDAFEYAKRSGDILMPREIAAVFCIPIGLPEEADLSHTKRKAKDMQMRPPIGYLYLDTDGIINNFTPEMGKFCKILGKIASIMIDNYNLKIASNIDRLTKLYTRKYFEAALQSEIKTAEKENSELSIIMIDIDKFKSVNDRFGHQKGDEILQNVSHIILNGVRKGDICGRYGGEEIIIILPSTGSKEARQIAETLRKKVENAKLLGLNTPLTISLGVSSYPEHSVWIKDLIEKADQALYNAKESGRNRSCVYEPNMSKTVKRIDKIAGIVSGNMVEDQRNVETMLEILGLQRNIDMKQQEKIFYFLGRVIEVSEAQMGIIFTLDDQGHIKDKMFRRNYVPTVVEPFEYNESLLVKSMEAQTGQYLLDWDNYYGIDPITNMPEWQSIIIVPMVNKNRLKAVLYLSVPIKQKEFDANAFNFIKTLCDVVSPIF